MDFSEGLGESGLDRWTEWTGAISLPAGNWDFPVADIAVPVAGKWAFSSRRRACSQASCS